MNVEEFRDYCLSLPYAEERFPFDETLLTFCISGHMFSLVDLERAERVNLKCDPVKALEWRDRYEGVIEGWHMNKKHWNTVYLAMDVPQNFIKQMVNDSYQLVYDKLTRKERETLTT